MTDWELERLKEKKMDEMLKEQAKKAGAQSAKVIVYSTSTCPYCVLAKQYLNSIGVKYEDVNVGTDKARAQEMMHKSGQVGVPVLDINGQIVIGFDRPAINAALANPAKK
jgi:glutaredoxin-like YruB-family protein